jgi:hypothetical protein
LKLPNDQSKYSNSWKWIELGRYDSNDNRVFRITDRKTKKPVTVQQSEAESFADENDRTGIYTSVFHYNNPDYEKATRLGSLYFDLDHKDATRSLTDAIKLAEYLSEFLEESQLRIYFTGMKGFHLECEALAIGVVPSNDLPSIFRSIANDLKEKLQLETIDFAVYDLRRMWRLPNTKHQKTGLYKIHVSLEDLYKGLDYVKELAKDPIEFAVPEQEFSYAGNRWYKEYEYAYEKSKLDQHSVDDVISLFRKNGTTGVRVSEQKEFNPVNLFDNCTAITRLWEKAESTGHLEHEERLFLCSILTYTDESVEYLHMILGNCHDYNYEKSSSHIDDWLARRRMGIGGRPYTCRRANEAGVGCGNCSLEPKKKWVRVGDSYIESDEFTDPSPIRYAYGHFKK